MAFKKANKSDGIKWEDLKGALLVIQPTSVETGIKTVHGDSDAVKANVTVIDGPNAGTVYRDTLIFPKLLQAAVRNEIGFEVLGRLGQGNKKPGQSAPWILTEFTDDEAELAEANMAKIHGTADTSERPF